MKKFLAVALALGVVLSSPVLTKASVGEVKITCNEKGEAHDKLNRIVASFDNAGNIEVWYNVSGIEDIDDYSSFLVVKADNLSISSGTPDEKVGYEGMSDMASIGTSTRFECNTSIKLGLSHEYFGDYTFDIKPNQIMTIEFEDGFIIETLSTIDYSRWYDHLDKPVILHGEICE